MSIFDQWRYRQNVEFMRNNPQAGWNEPPPLSAFGPAAGPWGPLNAEQQQARNSLFDMDQPKRAILRQLLFETQSGNRQPQTARTAAPTSPMFHSTGGSGSGEMNRPTAGQSRRYELTPGLTLGGGKTLGDFTAPTHTPKPMFGFLSSIFK